ncbi:hypothetical protein [Polaromonas sp. YR568]|uniref:hypothetical protein n=1 Tax=Polaromonas sp. YR568 TaxID=1855301 RepID=UPI003137BEA7
MKLYFKNNQWHAYPVPRPFNIYARVDGKLAQWSGEFQSWKSAWIDTKAEVGPKHRGAVMVVIK